MLKLTDCSLLGRLSRVPDLFGQSGQIVARRRRTRRRKSTKHFDQQVDGIRRLRLNRRRRTPGGDGCYLSSFRRRKKI